MHTRPGSTQTFSNIQDTLKAAQGDDWVADARRFAGTTGDAGITATGTTGSLAVRNHAVDPTSRARRVMLEAVRRFVPRP